MNEAEAYRLLDWPHTGTGNDGEGWLAYRCPTPGCQSEGVARSRELGFGRCGRCGAEMQIVSTAATTSPKAAKQQKPIDLAPKAKPEANIAESADVKKELGAAQKFAEELESLVVKRGQCPDDDRNILLMAYWALLFDFHGSVLNLIPKPLCGGAFALVRPCMEAVARAHVAVKGTAADIKSLQDDTYRTNFFTIGPWIDSVFGAGDLFTKMFDRARNALHSYAHAGISLGRDVDRYFVAWNGHSWVSYGPWLAHAVDEKFFRGPRLVIQKIRNPSLRRRLIAGYLDDDETYSAGVLLNAIPNGDNDDYSLFYALGILNSRLINYWYRKMILDVSIRVIDLKDVPIRKIDFTNEAQKKHHDAIVTAVEEMIELKKKTGGKENAAIRECDESIEQLVFDLYGIPNESRPLITREIP